MKKRIVIRQAELDDIDATLKLHYSYQIDSIAPDDIEDGFVTTPFTANELEKLISEEQGLFIAKDNGKVIAYVMSASWNFWLKWPMFAYMIENLSSSQYKDIVLSTENSYQYGPVCIDKKYRGSGLLEEIFDFALKKMSKNYPILVTFVNKNNPRSFAAHSKKLKLDVIQEFEFNNNQYYEMACLT